MKYWSFLAIILISAGCASQQGTLNSSVGSSAHRYEENPHWLVEANAPDNNKVNCKGLGSPTACRFQTTQKHSPMTLRPMNARDFEKITATNGPRVQKVEEVKEPVRTTDPAGLTPIESLALAPNLLPEEEGAYFPELSGEAVAEPVLTEEDILEPDVSPVEAVKAVETPAPLPPVQTAKVEPMPNPEPVAVDPELLTTESSAPASKPEAPAPGATPTEESPDRPAGTVTVNPGNTLIGIAQSIHPDAASRTAVALWMDNKEQFIAGNMNGLRAGKTLNLANLEQRLAKLDEAAARRALREQWAEWTARNQPKVAHAEPPASEAAPSNEDAPEANEADAEVTATPPEAKGTEDEMSASQPAAENAPAESPARASEEATSTAEAVDAQPNQPAAETNPEAEEAEAPTPTAELAPESPQAPEVNHEQNPETAATAQADAKRAAPGNAKAPQESTKPQDAFTRTLGNLQEKVTSVAEHIWSDSLKNFVTRVRGNPLLNKEP